MAEAFTISGLAGVLENIRTLPIKLQKKGLRSAMRKGGNIVRDAARANAQLIDDPETAENISKNIATQYSAKQSRQEGGVVMRVGVLGGARQYGATVQNRRKQRVGQSYVTGGDKSNPGGETFYWRFQELGSSKQRARPFLRPALQNNIERATDAIVKELNLQLDKLVATNS